MEARQQINRIYIVPTRHGLAFFGLIIVMVLVASGSGNNLIYGLAFVLFGIFFLAMIATHRNLKALEVELRDCEDGFAGEIAKVRLSIGNPASSARYLIRAQARQFSIAEKTELREIAALGKMILEVPLVVPRRGEYEIPAIQVSTVYPLGLFWSWTNLRFPGHLYVYPKREGHSTLQAEYFGEGSGQKKGQWSESQHEDFKEHSRYQTGESHHHVDWKAFARRGVLLTKRYEATSPQHYVIDWQMVKSLGAEKGLSQMSEWLSKLQTSDNSFELRMPGAQTGKGRGWQHGRTCLRALARFTGEAS